MERGPRIESGIAKQRHHRACRPKRARIAQLQRRKERDRVGVTQKQLPVIASQDAERLLPWSAPRYWQDKLREEPSDDALEEHGLRREVPVERHRLHAERGTKVPHGQRVEPLVVDQLDGGFHDSLGREGLAP